MSEPMSDRHRMMVDTPIGRLELVGNGSALVEIRFDADGRIDSGGHSRSGGDTDPVLARAAEQLLEYFAGTRTEFDLPLEPVGTRFQHQAWSVLREISYGETITYGEQAGRLGDRNKSRAVGAANGRNPIPIIVPCHRVIGANGHLTGFAGGLDTKAWLLAHERGVVENAGGVEA